MIEAKKLEVLNTAKVNGIKFITEEKTAERDALNLFPITDFKDIVVFLGSTASAIINKDFNFVKLAKQGFDAYVGYEKAASQFLDMTEEEFLDVYQSFEDQFEIEDDEELQKFVVARFMNAISEAKEIINFILDRQNEEKTDMEN